MDFKIKGLHSVLFFNSFSFSSPLQVVNKLNEWSNNLFDGNPMIPPLPNDVPSDFPRAILNSSDKKFALSISLARLDFVNKVSQNLGEDTDNIEKMYLVHLKNIVENIKDFYRANIGRIGCLGTFSMQLTDKNPNLYLYEKFFSGTKFFKDSSALEFSALTKDVFDERFDFNRWFRIRTINRQEDGPNDVIVVEIDINTFPEKAETTDFTSEGIQKFYNMAFARFKQDIREFFEGE